jgi:flagellar M-ring protein FliF
MGGVGLALMGFFAFLIMRAAAPQMVPLFTDLSVEDSSAIIKDLERQGIPYDIKNDGGIVLVPKEQVPRLRMKLAESGLPKGGGVGYEIFDKSDALGATSFVQNINHLRALEGELARTIRAIDRVQQARVHLVLPERPLFSRDKAEPSASIVLKVRGALEQQQVRAIRHLVASAVNGLKPQRVSIIDEAGRLLADGNGDDLAGGSTADERKASAEQRLRQNVEAIVTSVVGPGRAQVRVNVDFDFNRVTQTTDRFDPESRVVRSSQTREELSGANDSAAAAVSVGNDLPGGTQRQAQGQDGQPQQRDQNRKTEEVVNYEISRTTKTEVIEGGRINRLSVAVVVDGSYAKNDKGEMVYQPRTQEEIDRIAALVRSTVNFDAKRGDQVEVANLRLAETPAVPVAEPAGFMGMFQFTKDDIMRGIELGVMALLGLLALLLVVRPMLRRIMAQPAPQTPAIAGYPNLAALGFPGAAGAAMAAPVEQAPLPPPQPSRTSTMIDIAQVQGQVHAQSVQKVGDLADKNPNETAAIVRAWLHENAA